MSRPPKSTPTPVFVKRSPEQRRKLPPELEAFARSDDERLRIPRPRTDKGRVRDPREGYTIPGVANRDARAVYDVRAAAMQALWSGGSADQAALDELGQLLHDALRLELWRARRVTDFAAFVEDVVGVPAARAEALAAAVSDRTGEPSKPLTERAIALWMRTEAGLYEGDERARARVRSDGDELVIEIVVALSEASTALAGVGARHLPLARSPRVHEEPYRPGRPLAEPARAADDDAEDDALAPAHDAPVPADDADEPTAELAGGDEEESDDEAPDHEATGEAPAGGGALPGAAADDDVTEDGLDPNEIAALERATERASKPPPRPAGGARLLTRKEGGRDAPHDRGERADRGDRGDRGGREQPWGRHASRTSGDRGGRDDRGQRGFREGGRFGEPRAGGFVRPEGGRDQRSGGFGKSDRGFDPQRSRSFDRPDRGQEPPRGFREAPRGRGPAGGRFERGGDSAGASGGRFERGGKGGKFGRPHDGAGAEGNKRGPRFGQDGGGSRFGQGGGAQGGGSRWGKGGSAQGGAPRFGQGGAKHGGAPRFGKGDKPGHGGGAFGKGPGKSFGAPGGGGKFGKVAGGKGGKGFGARRPLGAGPGGRRGDDEPEE